MSRVYPVPMSRFACSLVAAAALGLLYSPAGPADVPPEQRAEVDHLVRYLGQSDCVMIRNGVRHDGAEAAQHVRRKYEHFRDKIGSTEEFIARSATKSLISGRSYQVQCPGEDPQPSADWLLAELEKYRAGKP